MINGNEGLIFCCLSSLEGRCHFLDSVNKINNGVAATGVCVKAKLGIFSVDFLNFRPVLYRLDAFCTSH